MHSHLKFKFKLTSHLNIYYIYSCYYMYNVRKYFNSKIIYIFSQTFTAIMQRLYKVFKLMYQNARKWISIVNIVYMFY